MQVVLKWKKSRRIDLIANLILSKGEDFQNE